MEGSFSNIGVYNLNTIGVAGMIDENGASIATYSDNVNVYGDGITFFKSN
jgi:glucan 1,3-beta-glucosidase